nr:MAG TPA: hypothetical protein [Caudoviricetes sp.]
MVGRRYSSVYIQIPIVKLLSSLHIFCSPTIREQAP